jgi:SAM-dependent methyltransferase
MPRQGELSYYEVIGEAGRHHAIGKPFTDPSCGYLLMRVGTILSLLPPPPGRVLECGCGTGWLAHLLQRRGYEVVGTDVSAHAIELATTHPAFNQDSQPTFLVGDSEHLDFADEFDAVVFFDSLHHSVDEAGALRSAYRALHRGGVCVTSEPGRGHHANSQEVVAQYDVTEKDMPADHIIRLGKQIGFRSGTAYPPFDELARAMLRPAGSWLRRLWRRSPLRYLWLMLRLPFQTRDHGFVVLTK